MTLVKSRRAQFTAVALLIGVVSLGSGVLLGFRIQPRFQTSEITLAGSPNDHAKAISACIDRTFERVNPPKVTAGLYERLWRLCSNEIFNDLFLEDFLIRREKFLRQYLDERVTLWLVVSITISGILLAAVQLFMSFKLASRGVGEFAKDSEFAIENTKLSIRSSITGAVILTLSLAFFMVYVIWIYTVREVPIEKPSNLQTPSEWLAPAAPENTTQSGAQAPQGAQGSEKK
jgi:hypothetical protein